ncbi:ECF RNA polymerase sigma factor SigW [Pirellulimonas nuda]|uniref:ECF RNA polymerase sigma factor SigW n=1 Tax=Pirellulimonas nuda TaxID=2528009 RepID=A0A518DHR8_9BACT|nr:sigma-70 family RNA polymerase sigma factor [Pirellulimonas nuda]QDU91014.1 ECF RNA polymerase sigma factor SigW [Pirellulimonas nuda]
MTLRIDTRPLDAPSQQLQPLDLTTATVPELVRAAQQGDRLAFGELAERYEGMVRSVALRRLGDWAEAQELCQEVMIKAMRRIDQLNEPAAFGGWLRSITVRMAINRQVRRRPDLATEPDALSAICAEASTPLDAVLAGERASQVHDGLDRLGEMDRSTLVAFYLRGESLAEISQECGAPIGTIKRRLHVARKRLADELGALQAV